MSTDKQNSIDITFVSEEDVIQHILPGNLTRNAIKKTNSGQDVYYTATFSMKKNASGDNDVEIDNNDEMDCFSGTSMYTDHMSDSAMFGEELFKFRTPKKSGQMAMKAEDCTSPKTPKSVEKPSPRTPKSQTPSRGKNLSTNRPQSPLVTMAQTPPRFTRNDTLTPQKSTGSAAVRDHQRVESSTPYRLRKRNMDIEHSDSSSDDSMDDSADDDDEVKTPQGKKGQMHGSLGMSSTAAAEAYFDLHSMATVTSDRTLSSLEGPRMEVGAVKDALKHFNQGHKRETKALREKHHKLFHKWMFNMCCGYNVLLYGLGSKRSLLEEFQTQNISKYSHLVVNGYFPGLTIKHILNSITEDILEEQRGFSNLNAHAKFIKDTYREKDEDFFLIIHNIDGILLRSQKTQTVLSQLAGVNGFHIIASIDHINAAFLWDQNNYVRFRWLWYETATFQPYESENAYENSLMVQQSGALALSSIIHVTHSLTPNGRRVFLMLAKHQLEVGDRSSYIGMSFQSLYQQCRESFLVNSDLTLQAQLVEFRDHRLIRSKKNYEGIEHLLIPVDKTTLKEFLQQYSETN